MIGMTLAGCLEGDDTVDNTSDVITDTTTGYLYDDPAAPTTVNTVVPTGFANDAPLAACFLENYQLTGAAENAALLLADAYTGDDEPTMAAATAFLADDANQGLIDSWLDTCQPATTGYLYDDPAVPTTVNTVVPSGFNITAPIAECILSNFQMTGAAENAALLFADAYTGDDEPTMAAAENFYNDTANNATITAWSDGCSELEMGTVTLEFGVPAWSGEMFRSYLAQMILEDAGYTVNLNEGLSPAPIYTGMANGDYHAYFGSWLPAQQATYEPNQDSLEIIGQNLEPGAAFLALAVPQYMCDAGLTKLSDLAGFADELDSTITGIEAGAGMQQTAEVLVEDGGYGLDGWTVSSSSTAAMLASYESAIGNNEHIVVMTWAPHAMYAKWSGDDAMCALEDDGYTEGLALGTEVIEFGVPAWSGEMFRSYLAQMILEDAGYTVNLNEGLSPAPIYTGMANGDYHAYFGSWLPAQQATYEPNQDSLEIIGQNLEPGAAFLALAVPQYMCDAGLTKLSDLAGFADELDSTITGIEAGAGMQQTAEVLVEDGGYGLDGWTVSSSSTAAMLASYESAIGNNEHIVVMTWAPHAMYAKWSGDDAMCALEDDGYEMTIEVE
jgi:ABC-type proline/glycine betaine transport system substrate-binding protein